MHPVVIAQIIKEVAAASDLPVSQAAILKSPIRITTAHVIRLRGIVGYRLREKGMRVVDIAVLFNQTLVETFQQISQAEQCSTFKRWRRYFLYKYSE